MKYFRFTCTSNGLFKDIISESQTYCNYLAHMYEYYFPATRTGSATSINIILADSSYDVAKKDLYCVGDIFINVNWNFVGGLSAKEKHKYFLSLCQNAIIYFIKQNGWNALPFENTFTKIQSNDFLFREHWKKSVLSPDKRLKAQIYFKHDYLSSGTYVDFMDKNNELLKRVQFTPSGYSIICDDVGLIRWIDDTHVAIFYVYTPRAGREAETNTRDYWIIGFDESVEFINPKINDDNPHAMYNLGLKFWDGKQIMPDKEKGILLITKSAELGFKHAQNWLKRINR